MRILKVIVKWSWMREFVCLYVYTELDLPTYIIKTKNHTHMNAKRVVLFISTIITTITLIVNNIKFGTSNITHVSKIEKFHHNFTAVSWFLVLFCLGLSLFHSIPFQFQLVELFDWVHYNVLLCTLFFVQKTSIYRKSINQLIRWPSIVSHFSDKFRCCRRGRRRRCCWMTLFLSSNMKMRRWLPTVTTEENATTK